MAYIRDRFHYLEVGGLAACDGGLRILVHKWNALWKSAAIPHLQQKVAGNCVLGFWCTIPPPIQSGLSGFITSGSAQMDAENHSSFHMKTLWTSSETITRVLLLQRSLTWDQKREEEVQGGYQQLRSCLLGRKGPERKPSWCLPWHT